jgi:iron only hydrogenase large subunit-like protein
MVAKEHLYEQRAAEIIALEQRVIAAEAAQKCAEEKAAQLQEELGMKAQESALAQMLSFKAEQQENDQRMADITNEKQATIDKRAAEAIAKLTETVDRPCWQGGGAEAPAGGAARQV